MSNSVTVGNPIPVWMKGDRMEAAIPLTVILDTTATDLTIYTPDSDRYAAIIGINYAESSAHSLTIKSGSTTINVWDIAASQPGVFIPLGSPLLVGQKGEALKFNTSAAIGSMLVYIAEFSAIGI